MGIFLNSHFQVQREGNVNKKIAVWKERLKMKIRAAARKQRHMRGLAIIEFTAKTQL